MALYAFYRISNSINVEKYFENVEKYFENVEKYFDNV